MTDTPLPDIPQTDTPQTWPEIRAWRKQHREALLKARMDAGGANRKAWGAVIEASLRRILPTLGAKSVGFYWPFKGEFDGRPLATELVASGMIMALPAVVQPKTPLEFRRWTPGMELESGVYDIPIPKARELIEPEVLLVPLVGFDSRKYRLGYGGGYYDRTIASFKKKPRAIGIGFELSRLPTIYPQPFDIPMSVIVTEAGTTN